jgi:hypothetical protein
MPCVFVAVVEIAVPAERSETGRMKIVGVHGMELRGT